MFGDNVNLTPTPSRSAALAGLRTRCVTSPEKEQILWKNAWNRFSVESFDQLPTKLLKAIRVDAKNADKTRQQYNCLYKRKTVEIFIPKLEKKIKLLTGAARDQASAALELLYLWEAQLPSSTKITAPERLTFDLSREEPPPILLPEPPKRRNKLTLPPKIKNPDGLGKISGVDRDNKLAESSEDELLSLNFFNGLFFVHYRYTCFIFLSSLSYSFWK